MAERRVIIGSSGGLHARPAKLFVEAAARQPVAVTIAVGDRRPVPAHSMLSVLSLGAVHGSEVTLRAEDADEAAAGRALDALADLLTRDLDGQETDGQKPDGRKPGDGPTAQEPAGA